MNKNIQKSGFTIVELLVVIVVIGILAAITITLYNGISNRAKIAAIESDLVVSRDKIELYKAEHGEYPVGIDEDYCPVNSLGNVDTKYCLKGSGSNILSYNSSGSENYSLSAANNDLVYRVTSGSGIAKSCPAGFINVPGSATYGQSDFCVMKYEAKNVGGVATSVAAGAPWVSIPQTNASSTNDATDLSAAACSGCHLITESEWLTIAQNTLTQDSNWSRGWKTSGLSDPGTDYFYRGHSDNSPSQAFAASSNDSQGYAYTTTGQIGDTPGATYTTLNQRRTLTLSNGEVIWDFAGNVAEWSSGQISNNKPGVAGPPLYLWYDWQGISLTQGAFSKDPRPVFANSTVTWPLQCGYGLGSIYSYESDTALNGFVRSGSYNNLGSTYDCEFSSQRAGIFALNLSNSPSVSDSKIGFRVAKSL